MASFLRNCWYVAGFPEEVRDAPVARTLLDEPVVLFRTGSGALAALDGRCPHRLAPLGKGRVVGETIQCVYHGLRFDAQGRCAHVPDGGAAAPRARLRAYPVVERHGLIWIWMGEAARADPALIVDFSDLERDDYDWWPAYLHARANYQLLVDNLLDLSHAEFLHPMLSSDGWAARNVMTLDQKGASIHVRNVAEDDNVLPAVALMRPETPKVGTTIQTERWDAPSLVRLTVDYQAEGCRIVIPSGHFLTPETDRTTHYFMRGGQNKAEGDAASAAMLRDGVLELFRTEDVPIVEAQQQALGDADLLDVRLAVLKGDAAGLGARRLLARMIREESAPRAAEVPLAS